MISQRIYKKDSTGRLRFWQYEVDEANGRWRSLSGIDGSSPTVSGWTVCTPKSQDTAAEQAIFEAKAEETKKLDREYASEVSDVGVGIGSCPIKPMLAHKYEGDIVDGLLHFTQPKLDGIRCIATKDGLFSRQGKPIVAVPHISAALQSVFEWCPDAIFDGELYNHDLRDDFNTIASVVKKQKPTDEDLQTAEKLMQYHIYDIPNTLGRFSSRYSILAKMKDLFVSPSLHIVNTFEVTSSKQLDEFYEAFLSDGYEGQMVRLDAPYQEKRSKHLLKRKEFQDAEYEVIAVEEGNGNWSGAAKRTILRLPDGREFGAGMRGTHDYLAGVLKGPRPSKATVRYFALTPDGVPRFPVVTALHEGERL